MRIGLLLFALLVEGKKLILVKLVCLRGLMHYQQSFLNGKFMCLIKLLIASMCKINHW